MTHPHGPLRVGVGGPVGSGKTALMDALCKRLRGRYEIAAITNDIYTKWDAEYLVRSGALAPERIAGVETGGCPHTAIREDASINLAAVAEMQKKFPALDLVLIESGGDNLAATFSPELADLTLYVIDVAAGDKIPSKGGPGITRSDLLVINKIDLAPHVGASLEVMERDAKRMRGTRPVVFCNLRAGRGRRRDRRFRRGQGRPAGGLGLRNRSATVILRRERSGARHPRRLLPHCAAGFAPGVASVIGSLSPTWTAFISPAASLQVHALARKRNLRGGGGRRQRMRTPPPTGPAGCLGRLRPTKQLDLDVQIRVDLRALARIEHRGRRFFFDDGRPLDPRPRG